MAFVSSSNNNTISTNGTVRIANEVSTASTQDNVAFSTNIDNLSDDVICSFFASQPSSPQLVHKELKQIHPDDIEEMDLRWKMAMLTMRSKRFLKRMGRKLTVNGNKTLVLIKDIKVLKAEIQMKEIVITELRKKLEIAQKEKDGIQLTVDKFENASKGNFMPLTPDLSFTGLDKFVIKPIAENIKSREEEPKAVRKNDNALIINEWGNPQIDLQDKEVIDSGCSRHMTGNMSYLTDYMLLLEGTPNERKSQENIPLKLVDEGFFVRYSLNSKAFRVFNSRTKIVEENLHIRFSESTPNVVGSEPYWLFDIDALKRTMNYEPITADPLFSQDPKSSYDDGSKPLSDDGKKADENPRKENECKDQENEDNVNNINNVNTISLTVNAASTNKDNELLFDPNMPALEDVSIFKFSNDDQDDDGCQKCFLYGKNKEEVYVCQLPGFEDSNFLDRVYKVKKALYRLHQAPKAWYETLSTYLLDNGFQRGKISKTLFIKRHKGDILLAQVYVDDIIFGLQVKQKKDDIFISQDKYVAKILKKFGFTEVKNASTPMKTQKPLLKDEDGEEVDVHMYRLMIGSLMYLTSLRPDIMFAVCACTRYQVKPKVSHLHAVKRIFRYLKGQPKLGLWYPKDSLFDLVAYTDSDYVGASLDRKSITRGCQFLGCRLISWQCKKQTAVANSTTEAEYMAASSCCGKVFWIQNQLLDYGDCNEKKLIQMIKIHTDKNVAELLTKAFDFWSTVMAKTINGEAQLHGRVDGKKIIITKASIGRDLQVADEEGVDCLPNSKIFEQLAFMRFFVTCSSYYELTSPDVSAPDMELELISASSVPSYSMHQLLRTLYLGGSKSRSHNHCKVLSTASDAYLNLFDRICAKRYGDLQQASELNITVENDR
nr:hypothetical protein [Tanacetum cinerariifolium]